MADVTLRHGIEALLRDEIPEIAEIVDATDHAAGDNPGVLHPARGHREGACERGVGCA